MKIVTFCIALSQMFPLLILLLFARFNQMTDDLWQQAFYLSGICALVITIFLLYKKIVIDRLRFGINLFILTGAFAFLVGAESLLRFIQMYNGVVFFGGIAVVGIITTFVSPLGFLGVSTTNKYALKKYSLMLLGATVGALIWSIIMNAYGTIVSIVLPFVGLRLLRRSLSDALMNKD